MNFTHSSLKPIKQTKNNIHGYEKTRHNRTGNQSYHMFSQKKGTRAVEIRTETCSVLIHLKGGLLPFVQEKKQKKSPDYFFKLKL